MSSSTVFGPLGELRRRPPELFGGEKADAVDLADARRVQPGQRAGVAHAVGRRHLGRVHRPRVPDRLIGERAARREDALPSSVSGPRNSASAQHLVVARVGEDVGR